MTIKTPLSLTLMLALGALGCSSKKEETAKKNPAAVGAVGDEKDSGDAAAGTSTSTSKKTTKKLLNDNTAENVEGSPTTDTATAVPTTPGMPAPVPAGQAAPAFNFTNYMSVPGWSTIMPTDSPSRQFTGDFNGDGKTDYLFTWVDGSIWVGLSDGSKFNFQLWFSKPDWGPGVFAANSPARFFIGDFNGDGKSDIAFVFGDGNIWVGLSDGTKFNWGLWHSNPAWGAIYNPKSASRIDLGDFNGDGKTDIVFTWVDGTWWVGLSTGNSFAFSNWKAEPAWKALIDSRSEARTFVADFTGDGKTDYLFTWADGTIWVGVSDGTKFNFVPFLSKPEWKDVIKASSPARMFAGNFNGDNKADLVFVWPDGNWWVGLSSGTSINFGLWAQTPQWAAVFAPGSDGRVLPMESNGDNKTDVMFTWSDGSIWVGESTGAAFQFRELYRNPAWGQIFKASSRARIQLGNFNGDAKLDFLFTWIDGTIWVGQ